MFESESKARGGIAAWDCSASRVLTLDTIDHLTTNMDFSADILARAMFFFQNGTFSQNEPKDDMAHNVPNDQDEDTGFDLYYSETIGRDVLLAFDNSTSQWGTVRVTQLSSFYILEYSLRVIHSKFAMIISTKTQLTSTVGK